jgi:regulator of RNase E activity RraB
MGDPQAERFLPSYVSKPSDMARVHRKERVLKRIKALLLATSGIFGMGSGYNYIFQIQPEGQTLMFDYYIHVNDDDRPVKTYPNLEIEAVPDPRRAFLGYLFLKIRHPDEHGWCEPHECDVLYELQRTIEVELASLDAIISGMRIQDGWLELFYYLPAEKNFEKRIRDILVSGDSYAFETGTYRDAKWDHYLSQIYPDTLMMQQMQNRQIITELENEGDDIEKAREVEHYVFFQTVAQRDRCIASLEQHGMQQARSIEGESEYPYGAILLGTHAVTEETMMQITVMLIESTQKEFGHYEGWSTTLAQS